MEWMAITVTVNPVYNGHHQGSHTLSIIDRCPIVSPTVNVQNYTVVLI